MENIIPWHRQLKFDNKVYEITSITFLHDYKIEDYTITGDFTISGEYRISEISVNKEPFNFRLPFNIELSSDVDLDTVELEITDFNYDLETEDTISVNIEIKVNYDRIEIVKEELFKELDDDYRSPEEVIEEEIIIPDKEEVLTEDNSMIIEETVQKSEKMEGFVKYRIHIIKEQETIEEIISTYHITREELEKYNNLVNINIGDKLIIPEGAELD